MWYLVIPGFGFIFTNCCLHVYTHSDRVDIQEMCTLPHHHMMDTDVVKKIPPSLLNQFSAGSEQKSKKGSAGEFQGKWCSVAICSRATNIGPPLSLLDPTSPQPAPYASL